MRREQKTSKQKVAEEKMTTLRSLREAAGLSVKQFSQMIGVAEDTVNKYEISDRVPRKCNLAKLQRALGCTKQDMSKAYIYHNMKYIEKKGLDMDYILMAQ